MKESTVEFSAKREIKSHSDLADQLGLVKDEERSVSYHAIYAKEVQGKVLTISFQNSKLEKEGVRVSFGLWSNMDSFRVVNEINFCQDPLFENIREELGLLPRESDRFFEKSDLEGFGYKKLTEYIKHMEENGLLEILSKKYKFLD